MPIFVEISSKKVMFVFQRESREVWLHYYAHKGMPPQWPPSCLNLIEHPQGEYLEFDDVSAYVQNKIEPPTEQILCWIRNHLPNLAQKEKFNFKKVDYGEKMCDGKPIKGCGGCSKVFKIWPLKRYMCCHPDLKDKSFKWGYTAGKLTMVEFGQIGFPAWCPLTSFSSSTSDKQ